MRLLGSWAPRSLRLQTLRISRVAASRRAQLPSCRTVGLTLRDEGLRIFRLGLSLTHFLLMALCPLELGIPPCHLTGCPPVPMRVPSVT